MPPLHSLPGSLSPATCKLLVIFPSSRTSSLFNIYRHDLAVLLNDLSLGDVHCDDARGISMRLWTSYCSLDPHQLQLRRIWAFNSSSLRTVSSSFTLHSWSTPKIYFRFPRHSYFLLVLPFGCPNTCKTNCSHVTGQAGTFSNPSSRDTSQKTRNNIVEISFIESKLAISISLLMF